MTDEAERIESLQKLLDTINREYSDCVNSEIRDWVRIKEVVSYFVSNDKGSPIVDFIDLYNWDSVESFTFDDGSRVLELVWHDFAVGGEEGVTTQAAFVGEETALMNAAYGGETIKCSLMIDSISLVSNEGYLALLIKTFYKNSSTIRRELNTRCSSFEVCNRRMFSVDVGRVVKGRNERIIIPNINCFTVALIPNCLRFLSATSSRKMLYRYNITVIEKRLHELVRRLEVASDYEHQEIQSVGNDVRKCFENVLKIFNLNAENDFDKDYQNLMLGDLVGVLNEPRLNVNAGIGLRQVIDLLNTCSHDSGSFVLKESLRRAALFVVEAIRLQEVK